MFDFDCPCNFINLNVPRTSPECHDWFLSEHPLHEPQTNNLEESFQNKNRVSSGSIQPTGTCKTIENKLSKNKPNRLTNNAVFISTTTKSVSNVNKSMAASSVTLDTKTSNVDSIRSSNAAKSVANTVNQSMSAKLEIFLDNKLNKNPTKQVLNKKQIVKKDKNTLNAERENLNANQDMLAILKMHNAKFTAAPLYEPPRHAVRDIRKWERKFNKSWVKLTPEEREAANADITSLKLSEKWNE